MRLITSNFNVGAVKTVIGLSFLLVTLTVALVWLVANEFDAENLIADARIQLIEMQRKKDDVAGRLAVMEEEVVALRSKPQQKTTAQDPSWAIEGKDRDALLAKIYATEEEAKWARRAAGVAQKELKHAIEQSRKIEKNLREQLLLIEKEKHKLLEITSDADPVDIIALKAELKTVLQQLTSAKDELLTLRSKLETQNIPRNTTLPPVPALARPLSSPSPPSPLVKTIFGQVKAVEPENQFALVQLNLINGVSIGDALTVTRKGIPVGVLRVYRVGPQNVVFTTLTPDLQGKVRAGDEVTLKR